MEETVLDRINNEYEELYAKAIKLQKTLASLPKDISADQVMLMRKQFIAMNDYLNVLQARMYDLEHAMEAAEQQAESDGEFVATMDFGEAIDSARYGMRIARQGWNGKGMHVVLMPGYKGEASEATSEIHGMDKYASIRVMPYWTIKTADGIINTWAPSVSDTLALDWYVV